MICTWMNRMMKNPMNDEKAISLITEMLNALEEVQGDLTSGWLEPRSIAMTLCSVRPAILNARKFLKEHKHPHNEASNHE